MALPKTLQCPKCERKFAREGHLARHMNSIHGMGGRKKSKNGKRLGRPPGSGKRAYTKRAPSASFGAMSLEQLTSLITDARNEAQKRWKGLKQMLKNL